MRPYYGSIENKNFFMYDRQEVQRKLGIGKSRYYQYLKATGVQPIKRDGRITITQAELDILLAYKESLNSPLESSSETTKKPLESKVDTSDSMPVESHNSTAINPAESQLESLGNDEGNHLESPTESLAESDESPIESIDELTNSPVNDSNSSPMSPVEDTSDSPLSPVLYEVDDLLSEPSVEDLDLSDETDFDALIRIAQAKKAKQILQPELVMAHLVEQMTEDDLPEDLRRKIEQPRRAIRDPLANPAAIASQILTKYRSGSTQKT